MHSKQSRTQNSGEEISDYDYNLELIDKEFGKLQDRVRNLENKMILLMIVLIILMLAASS